MRNADSARAALLKVGDDRSENRYHNDRQPQNDHQAIQERP